MPFTRVGVLPPAGQDPDAELEPSAAELTALALQEPVRLAELALVDAVIAAVDAAGCRDAARRIRRARAGVLIAQLAVIAALVANLVGSPPDYGEGRRTT